jgi:hypothetical protein
MIVKVKKLLSSCFVDETDNIREVLWRAASNNWFKIPNWLAPVLLAVLQVL